MVRRFNRVSAKSSKELHAGISDSPSSNDEVCYAVGDKLYGNTEEPRYSREPLNDPRILEPESNLLPSDNYTSWLATCLGSGSPPQPTSDMPNAIPTYEHHVFQSHVFSKEIPQYDLPTANSLGSTPCRTHSSLLDKGKSVVVSKDQYLPNSLNGAASESLRNVSTEVNLSHDFQAEYGDPVVPPESPRNSVGSDIESIFANPNLDLAALTVFDKPPLSSNWNPIDRSHKVTNKTSRGKFRAISLFADNENDLTDIPIMVNKGNRDPTRALRARNPALASP